MSEVKRDAHGLFVKGTAGGPGRPKDAFSIKDLVRKHLQENPGELDDFIKHFIRENRELAWQMLEGKPSQDVTSGGEKLPTPLLHVLHNDGDEKDQPSDETS